MDRYEETIKGLLEAQKTAREAASATGALVDKLRFIRLEKAMEDAWRILRLHYFDYEDAICAGRNPDVML